MPLALRRHYSYADYLQLERGSNVKHEYLDGEIYAMAGGSPEHAALAAAISIQLGMQLRGKPCRVYSSDLRVRVLATGLTTYPDVTVVCGQLALDPDDRDTAINPRLLVEVLSDSTESYDRGEKLRHYQQIPSLHQVLLVASRQPRIENWQRGEEGTWQSVQVGLGEELPLTCLKCVLVVDEVYRNELAQPPT